MIEVLRLVAGVPKQRSDGCGHYHHLDDVSVRALALKTTSNLAGNTQRSAQAASGIEEEYNAPSMCAAASGNLLLHRNPDTDRA